MNYWYICTYIDNRLPEQRCRSSLGTLTQANHFFSSWLQLPTPSSTLAVPLSNLSRTQPHTHPHSRRQLYHFGACRGREGGWVQGPGGQFCEVVGRTTCSWTWRRWKRWWWTSGGTSPPPSPVCIGQTDVECNHTNTWELCWTINWSGPQTQTQSSRRAWAGFTFWVSSGPLCL